MDVKFLQRVWKHNARTGSYVFLCTKSTTGKWREHAFRWPVSEDSLHDFYRRFRDRNIYFCPLAFHEGKRRKNDALPSRLLWADLDERAPKDCPVVPNIAWQSSPGRYAALWTLTESREGAELERLNKSCTYASGADRAGWDLTQVLRVPGTVNYKYRQKPRVKQLWFKETAYAPGKFTSVARKASGDPREILKKYKIPGKILRLLTAKRATQGKRSEVLWGLYHDLMDVGMDDGEIVAVITPSVWNKFDDRPGQLEREVDKAREAYNPDKRRKTGRSVRVEREPIELVQMSKVAPEHVEWLWKPYIPLGKVTLLEGDPGLGKSWLTMAIAAHLTTKRALPMQRRGRNGRVLLMSAEDGLGDTIRPRLDGLGANSRLVFAIPKPVVFDADGLAEVENQIRELRPLLVIVDPLVAYLGGGVDLHKANETREVMAGMGVLAEKYKCAVLAVRHLRKASGDKSIYRGLGSIDLTAAARSVLLAGRDPDDDNARAFAHIKSNLAPTGPTIRYYLDRGSLQWDGPCELTADEISKVDKAKASPVNDAIAFLRERLAEGPVLKQKVMEDAEARGISSEDLRRARLQLQLTLTKGRWTL